MWWFSSLKSEFGKQGGHDEGISREVNTGLTKSYIVRRVTVGDGVLMVSCPGTVIVRRRLQWWNSLLKGPNYKENKNKEEKNFFLQGKRWEREEN